MSRAIRSYPKAMQPTVVARRMRTYDPKGWNGIGTLAAHDYHVKHYMTTHKKVKSESPSDVRRREARKQVSDAS